jgi:hypothetical protein
MWSQENGNSSSSQQKANFVGNEIFNLSPARKLRFPVKTDDLKQEKSKNLNIICRF